MNDIIWDIKTIKRLRDERIQDSATDKWNRRVIKEVRENIKEINEKIDNLKIERDQNLEIIPALAKLDSIEKKIAENSGKFLGKIRGVVYDNNIKLEKEKSIVVDRLEELKVERGFRSVEDKLNRLKHRTEEIKRELKRLDTKKICKDFIHSSKRMELHGNTVSISLEEAVDKLCEEEEKSN
ncbi:MAG: hypothetical protein KAI71_05415 [Candidatus Pacebacteria bacterium]|nr:hypothetical protein [Candidatus Paceibacterota bacterium]